MIRGRAVNGHARPGGVVRDHPAERGARARGHIRTKAEAVGFEERVQLIEHNSGADSHRPRFQIEIGYPAVMRRELDDQTIADRAACQPAPSAARRDGDALVRRGPNHRTGLLRAARERHRDRFDLIDGRVGRVELTRQIIESQVAICGFDSSFARRHGLSRGGAAI